MVQAAGILLANLSIAVGEATAVIGCMTTIRHRTLNNASSAPSDASTFGLSIMLGSTAHSSGQALREPTMTILLAAATQVSRTSSRAGTRTGDANLTAVPAVMRSVLSGRARQLSKHACTWRRRGESRSWGQETSAFAARSP